MIMRTCFVWPNKSFHPRKCENSQHRAESIDVLFLCYGLIISVVNLIKHFTIVIYDSRVVLTTKLPIL